MSSSELESCFTCMRRTENFLCITEKDEGGGENVEEIFARHFWFTQNEYQDRMVCTSCWEKIDEFHKFYCEVERVHIWGMHAKIKTEKEDAEPEDPAEQLEEPPGAAYQPEQMFVEPMCQIEVKQEASLVLNEDSEETDEDESDANQERRTRRPRVSPKETKVSPAKPVETQKRKRIRRKKDQQSDQRKEKSDNDELNEIIRQHIDITCHKCAEAGTGNGEIFDTFYRLNLHFRKEHGTYTYVYCCGRKWNTKPALVEHLKKHNTERIDLRTCIECNCTFKDQESYAHHAQMMHTPDEEKQFRCNRCPKAFSSADLLNSHFTWHDDMVQRNHHCTECNKYFISERILENHISAHHNPTQPSLGEMSFEQALEENSNSNPPEAPATKRTVADLAREDALISQFISLNCTKCDFIGETFYKLTYHALKVHKMERHPVFCCDLKLSKRSRVYEHCLKHINPDHFKCEICGKIYTDSKSLQSHHWLIHTPASARPFKCDVCGDAFVKQYMLRAHLNRHLNIERKTYTCDTCGSTYTSSGALKAHKHSAHGVGTSYVCDICAKSFHCRTLLETHQLTHTEEGLSSLKAQCEKCFKWFANKKTMFRHSVRCGVCSPAKCDLCDHVSVNAPALQIHKRLNHTVRPKFDCRYCGKEFRKKLKMQEHEANHEGIVLYKCPYCPRECNSSSNMYTHKKTAHPEKWAEAKAARYSK